MRLQGTGTAEPQPLRDAASVSSQVLPALQLAGDFFLLTRAKENNETRRILTEVQLKVLVPLQRRETLGRAQEMTLCA